jgi:hypothetical protein
MFELEKAVDGWRRQIEATWRGEPSALAELEDHLREDFAALIRSGRADHEAWRMATARLGDPITLGREFAKVKQLSVADRTVLALMIGAAPSIVGLVGWVLFDAGSNLTVQPLLATHVVTITCGYVAGLLAAGVAAYATVRSLLRPASTAALEHATLRVLRSSSLIATALSLAGFVLGAIWAKAEWGSSFTGQAREVGALLVIALFAVLAAVAWSGRPSTRPQLAIATCGGGVVLAAWLGAASLDAGGSMVLQAVGFGGLALSLGLAAISIAVEQRRCTV